MIIPSKLVLNTRPLNISNSIKPATKVGNTTKQYISKIKEALKYIGATTPIIMKKGED